MYTFEERMGGVLLLSCLAVLAGITFWYPLYLCAYHSSPDDRYGFAIVHAMPFWFLCPALAVRGLVVLMRAVKEEEHSLGNALFGVVGAILGLVAVSPIIVMILGLVFRK